MPDGRIQSACTSSAFPTPPSPRSWGQPGTHSVTFSLRLSACSGIPYTCSMPGREKSKPTDVGPGRRAEAALRAAAGEDALCRCPGRSVLTVRLAVRVSFERLLPGPWLLFVRRPLRLFRLWEGGRPRRSDRTAFSPPARCLSPLPTARRPSPANLPAARAPTTHPTHLPCRHPPGCSRAGRPRPQRGLWILAWKVGELSAPIRRGGDEGLVEGGVRE